MENDLLKKFGLHGDPKLKKRPSEENTALNNMASPSYLRQSSALINEALKSGFDVLQLANGDIVTTGTKVVINRYVWDMVKGKLVKTKPDLETGEAKKLKPKKEAGISVEAEEDA